MCAIGAGISTASSWLKPWTRAMSDAFQLKARCVCSAAFGVPVEPEVNSTSATSDGRTPLLPTSTGAPPSFATSAAGSEMVSASSSSVSAGFTWARAAATSAVPNECSTGAATAPNRQQARGRTAAARLLGTCQATASPLCTPLARKPPATRATTSFMAAGDRRAVPSTTSPPCVLSNASSVGPDHGPPAARYRRAWLGTQVARRRAVTAGHHNRPQLT